MKFKQNEGADGLEYYMSPKKTGELELEDRSENPVKCHREIKRWKTAE